MARKRIKGYCVYTVPAGQTPPRKMKCFRTKKAARAFARRERYTQVIPLRGLGKLTLTRASNLGFFLDPKGRGAR